MELRPLFTIEHIGAVLAAVLSFIGIWRLLIRPIWQVHRSVMETVATVRRLRVELGPNGGASLRDALDRVEVAVSFQDKRSRALLQDASHGYVETDGKGFLTYANRTYLRWVGRSLEEMLGEGWVNAIDPSDRSRLFQEWKYAVEGARDLDTVYKIRTPDAETRVLHTHCYVIHGEQGPLGWAAIIHQEDSDAKLQ